MSSVLPDPEDLPYGWPGPPGNDAAERLADKAPTSKPNFFSHKRSVAKDIVTAIKSTLSGIEGVHEALLKALDRGEVSERFFFVVGDDDDVVVGGCSRSERQQCNFFPLVSRADLFTVVKTPCLVADFPPTEASEGVSGKGLTARKKEEEETTFFFSRARERAKERERANDDDERRTTKKLTLPSSTPPQKKNHHISPRPTSKSGAPRSSPVSSASSASEIRRSPGSPTRRAARPTSARPRPSSSTSAAPSRSRWSE